MKYSIIVPLYNEEKNIIELQQRLQKVMNSLSETYELIFIDDGSTDDTLNKLLSLKNTTIIKFRKNFGQTAALDAGIKNAQGEFIITLDGDLQNPPEEIPKLINEQKKGFDVVCGWRYHRRDNFIKKFTSRGANLLRKIFINDKIHDSGCTLKIFKRECFIDLDLFGEMHRFIPGVLKWQGFKISEVKVAHAPRLHGQTKYKSDRVLKGLVDMIGVWFWRKYSSRPLHLFGGGGLLAFLAGFILLSILGILRLLNIISLSDKIWPLVAIFLMLAGVQLFVSGLIGEILVKNYFSGNKKPYNIEKIETT